MDVWTDRDRLLRATVYPGMVPAESRILRQFIARHLEEVDEWRFNVRLGEGVELGADADPKLRKSWAALTKARPDTVAFKRPNLAAIIEVKEGFFNEGAWQLLSYRDVYVKQFPEHEVRLLALATETSPAAREVCRNNGITLILYRFASATPNVTERAEEASPNDV